MTLSTLPVVPDATTASGTAACAEPATVPTWWARSIDLTKQAVARAARPDYEAWLTHVKPASACVRPVRLAGTIATVEAATGRLLAERSTADMPDGVIYKPCGNRREKVCPSCSKLYQNDAYHVVRTGLIGGKGVPDEVAHHPAVFPTFTAPSFGEVHTRVVKRHTCARRTDCDCRPEPCHARRDLSVCPHGIRLACFARHSNEDTRLGTPLCLDCYPYAAQAVWNLGAGELWRRTTIAVNRYIRRLARQRGIPDVETFTNDGQIRQVPPVRLSFGKAAEMQRRGVVHFHAIVRLDGVDPFDPAAVVPPPPGIDAHDLVAAIDHATATIGYVTAAHPARPGGWYIGWGEQQLTKVITVAGLGEVTDGQVAAYLAKYATKATEITGHTSARLTNDTIDVYADPTGTHVERLVAACWSLAHTRWRCPAALCQHHHTCPACVEHRAAKAAPTTTPFVRLRRWAHMLGFGGHFLTKSRRYSITFALLRDNRVVYRRTQKAGPEQTAPDTEPTTLVVNFLEFVGAGWRTPADAMLANTSAQMAREHAENARQYLNTLAA
ncbi:replication initiator [Paractinoplanes lichenicola]|uniref:Plasmid replication initiator protein n=1 Tax=Paractinoplanes lichenicola TaxID=2802976 RepID=A0ABS1VXH6_9ACTN|nr:replication initiator [Actinoplanes lichenicola]MBL7259169.1 plasmid replication initiator protein [Actinoplanes lichenicola]